MAYTKDDLNREREEVSKLNFENVPLSQPLWLMKKIRELQLAFNVPKTHIPVTIKGSAKRALKKAITNSSRDMTSLVLDGEEYVLMKKSIYRRKRSPL